MLRAEVQIGREIRLRGPEQHDEVLSQGLEGPEEVREPLRRRVFIATR